MTPADEAEFRFYVEDQKEQDGHAALNTMDALHASAETGNLESLYYLGMRYCQGNGCNIDNAKAAEYWDQAAAGGHVRASFQLGVLLCKGEEGVENDDRKGKRLLEYARKHGIPEAQAYLRNL